MTDMSTDRGKIKTPLLGDGGRWQAPPTQPPIGDYAVIGDCRTAALISRDGATEWLCLPQFSSPSWFASVLDRRRGGAMVVQPLDRFTVTRRYQPATAVLETIFETAGGTLRVADAMPILAGSHWEEELQPEREIVKLIEVLAGEVRVGVCFAPRPNYGSGIRLHRAGTWDIVGTHRAGQIRLRSEIPMAIEDGRHARAEVRLRAGQRRRLAMNFTHADVPVLMPLGESVEDRLAQTVQWWRRWWATADYRGAHQASVMRSAITLKLLTYPLSGAVVAAPTTSLPEEIGGSRNWDYRYCWLRDAALILRSFIDLGFLVEGDSFLRWLLHATRRTRPRLQVLYDIHGRTRIRERTLHHLTGYRRSRPVRVGNAARHQTQLDIYGSVILAAYEFARRKGKLEPFEAKLLQGLGRTVQEHWREPDQGLWEMRGRPRHHTYSKLMCWVALDRLIRLHEQGHVPGKIPHALIESRRQIAETVRQRGFSTSLGGYSGELDGHWPDASLLLLARHGFESPNSPAMRGTFDLIDTRLGEGVLIRRYPPEEDALPGGEGAFGVCAFWAVDYLARAGRIDEAQRRFETLLGYANDVGLYGEEMNPRTGEALGNFPQGLTHVGALSAALTLSGEQMDGPYHKHRVPAC